jgi:hypothetical protein
MARWTKKPRVGVWVDLSDYKNYYQSYDSSGSSHTQFEVKINLNNEEGPHGLYQIKSSNI